MNRKIILIAVSAILVAAAAYLLRTGDFQFLMPFTMLALVISAWICINVPFC